MREMRRRAPYGQRDNECKQRKCAISYPTHQRSLASPRDQTSLSHSTLRRVDLNNSDQDHPAQATMLIQSPLRHSGLSRMKPLPFETRIR